METQNEIQEEKIIKWDDLEVGEDVPAIEPKTVVIQDWEIREVKNKEMDKLIGNKIVFKVMHPDSEELLELSSYSS